MRAEVGLGGADRAGPQGELSPPGTVVNVRCTLIIPILQMEKPGTVSVRKYREALACKGLN